MFRKILGLFIVCYLLFVPCISQCCDDEPDHFVFNSLTGNSYSIVIDSLDIDCNLAICDEIAIFDGDLCVGAAVYDGNFPIGLTAWEDDSFTPEVDGYVSGDTMYFRVWRFYEEEELAIQPIYDLGNGQFGNGPFSKLWIRCFSTEVSNYDNVIPVTLNSENYPNPFNASTVIEYYLERKAMVTLSIYNILGEKVICLLNKTQSPGQYLIEWNGKNSDRVIQPTGIYFYKLTRGGYSESNKMVLLK